MDFWDNFWNFVWIFFWTRLYRRPEEHPKVSPEELAHIRSDAKESTESLGVSEVFGMRPVYAVAMAKFFTDAPWWFYLTWLPKFLVGEFKLTPTFMAYAIPVVFIVADVGAIGGGWLSSKLIARGRSVGTARKLAMLDCALAAVPVAEGRQAPGEGFLRAVVPVGLLHRAALRSRDAVGDRPARPVRPLLGGFGVVVGFELRDDPEVG